MSQEQLAFESELDRTYISQLERGKKTPTLQTIYALCRPLGLQPEEMIAQVSRQQDLWKRSQSNENKEWVTKLPIFGTSVSCGTPLTQDSQKIEDELSLDELLIKNDKSTFFVRANGDSMAPTIEDDNYLVIDSSLEIKNDSIILAQVDNDFCIKRYSKQGDRVVLKADNPLYGEIVLGEDLENFIYCGSVTAVIRRF